MADQLFLPGALWPGMLLGGPGPQPLAMPDEAGPWLPGMLLGWPGARPLAMPEETGAWLPERREGAWLPASSWGWTPAVVVIVAKAGTTAAVISLSGTQCVPA